MAVRVTRVGAELLSSPVVPVTPLAIPEVLVTLGAINWRGGVRLETAWRTQVLDAFISSAEERTGTWARPARVMEVQLSALTLQESQRLLQRMARHAMGRQPVPVYCDVSKATAEASGTAIACDTRWRRFAIGARCLILSWSGPYNVGSYELGVVQEIAPDGLTLTSSLSTTYPAGSHVFPVMDAEAVVDSVADWLDGNVAETSLEFLEVPGPSALPPAAVGRPDGAQETWDGIPIMDVSHEWGDGLAVSIRRDGSLEESGRGTIEDLGGARPRLVHEIESLETNRAGAWRLLEWFDSRCGKMSASVLVSPLRLFEVEAVGARTVDVVANGNPEDVLIATDMVALVETDGTIHVRRIATVEDLDADSWRMTLEATEPDLSVSVGDVERTTTAHLVRFDEDALEQDWKTATVASSSFALLELLEEDAYDIPNVEQWPDTATYPGSESGESPLPDLDAGLYLWVDASKNTWQGDSEDAAPTKRVEAAVADDQNRHRVDYWDDLRLPGQVILDSGSGFPNPHLRSHWHGLGEDQDKGGFLRSFKAWNKNKGRDIVESAGVAGTHFKLIESTGQRAWSNVDGFTIAWVGRLKSTENHRLLEYDGPNGTALRFRHDRLEVYSDITTSTPSEWLDPIDDLRSKSSSIIVARWIPSTEIKVWRAGKLMGSKTSGVVAAIDESDVGDLPKALDFDGEENGPDDIDHIGVNCFTSAFAIWRRALTKDEINELAALWANLYKAKWKDLT